MLIDHFELTKNPIELDRAPNPERARPMREYRLHVSPSKKRPDHTRLLNNSGSNEATAELKPLAGPAFPRSNLVGGELRFMLEHVPKEHPRNSPSSNELVVERRQHVQDDQADRPAAARLRHHVG